jgi:hypothetical protein
MPYNTTAIPRRSEKEPTGTTQLPCKCSLFYDLLSALTLNSVTGQEDDASRPRYQRFVDRCLLRHHSRNGMALPLCPILSLYAYNL